MPARLNGGATRTQIVVVCVIAAIALALAILATTSQQDSSTNGLGSAEGHPARTSASTASPVGWSAFPF